MSRKSEQASGAAAGGGKRHKSVLPAECCPECKEPVRERRMGIIHWLVPDGAEAAREVHKKWRFTQETKHGKRAWSDRLVEWAVRTARAHLGKRAGASRVQRLLEIKDTHRSRTLR